MAAISTRVATVLALLLTVACGSSTASNGTDPALIQDIPRAEIDYGQEDALATDGESTDATEDAAETDSTADATPCTFTTSSFGFRDNCDGTVTDTNTGWMWEKSYQWVASLPEAQKACSNCRVGEFNDWRLPTIDEMRSLILGCPATGPTGACPVHALANCIDETCWNDTCFCDTNQGPVEKPGDPSRKCYMDASFEWYCNLFWTGTQVKAKVKDDKRSWYVTFYDAGINVPPSMAQVQSAAMRCVRGP